MRKTLKNAYFRISVPYFVESLNKHDDDTQNKANKATRAFYDEITDIFAADGWRLKDREFLKPHSRRCPQMKRGAESLYFHPQNISGHILEENIATIEGLIRSAKTLQYRMADIYGDVYAVESDEDERALYAELYDETIQQILQNAFTTPRRNLYKQTFYTLFERVYNAVHIDTTRHNCSRTSFDPGFSYIREMYDEAVNNGLIIVANSALSRWVSKNDKKRQTA